jgi:hypothetical protein
MEGLSSQSLDGRRTVSQIEFEEAAPSDPECTAGDSCLSAGGTCPCEIQDFVYNMVLFVKPPGDLECMYMMPLGEEFFCVSPMRKEIYERFGPRA